MRRRRLFNALLAGAVALGPVTPHGLLRAEEADAPILTGDAQFAIPVEAAAGNPAQAEVRLYVSDDAGKSWKLHRRAKTPAESFEFNAAGDKEYWFCVRSADAAGRETTTDPMSPELRVTVDSTPPKIDLEAKRNAAGNIVLDWKIDDRHAAPDTLKLTYRSLTAGPATRSIVPLRSKRQGDDRNAAGQIEFRPEDAGAVIVKAETTDRAANHASVEVTIEEAVGPAAADLPKTAAIPGAGGASLGGPTSSGFPSYAPPAASTPGFGPSRLAPSPTPSNGPTTSVPTTSTPTQSGPGRTPATPIPTPIAAANPSYLKPAVEPIAAPGLAAPSMAGGPRSDSPAASVLPTRDPSRPLMVNSTSFELDYELIPGAVTNVEVWGTRDDGRSWVLLGADDDRASPTAVSVDKAGVYGFTIVVDSAAAPARRPQSGDKPEIRVGVDLSIPTVRLTTAEPDADNTPCRLKINWEAKDDNLGAQAVSLAYAGSPAGPWLPLAAGVPNDGGFTCNFDPQGPDNAYLRIEVRDEAGNLGTFTTSAPIPIEKRPVTFHFAGAQSGDAKKPGPKWYHVLR
jgi:hypothetical protein